MTVLQNRERRQTAAVLALTSEVLPLGSRTLEECALAVNESHSRVVDGLATALREAISSGQALIEAQGQIEVGQFAGWLKENCVITHGVAMCYMRLAAFHHLLPDELVHPVITRLPNGKYESTATVEKALAYLKSIGAIRATGSITQRVDYGEIRRLKQSGMKNTEIAKMLAVSISTVAIALMSDQERRAFRARGKARRREVARALKNERRLEASKKVGGDLAEAYSLLRRCLQHVHSAQVETPGGKARRTLQGALTHLYESEDAVARAIRDAGLSVDHEVPA